jgi:DNA invertase Pin-like site-specific DNA recombinase
MVMIWVTLEGVYNMANGQKVGYIRVSTIEQNIDRQVEAFKDLKLDRVFSEKLSGKDTNRPQLKACLEYLREGDTLYINEYSRLARSTTDLLQITDGLAKKGVTLVSLKEKLDTSTPQGKFMLTVFAGIGQFERELILQRQREGIAEAKKQGKYKGRTKKEKPENWDDLHNQYMTRKISASELAKQCNVSRPVIYTWLKTE